MGEELESPLFILGNPRSGTSLLRIMLNAHPNIVVPPESGFIQWWHAKYTDWVSDDLNHRLDEFITDLLSSKKIEDYGFDAGQLTTFIREHCPSNYAQLMALVYIHYAGNKEAKVWGDKNNYYIHHIPLLKKIYPKARFIHLVRDGRDVACSYRELSATVSKTEKYVPVLPEQLDDIAREWSSNNELIAGELEDTDFITVRYEDVVSSSEKTLAPIISFLKLPWSERVLEYYAYNDEPEATMKWKKKTKLQPQVQNLARYKKDLTSEEVDQFNTVAGKVLNKYGYL